MAPSKASLNRMSRDLKAVLDAPPAGISAWLPSEANVALVEAQVVGPDATPYAGGVFQLQIALPDRYPHEPPNVKFKTKVYHPNVSHDGNICLNILNMPPKGDWTPALNLATVLLSIQNLLAAPNPDDPLDAEAARELKMHPHLFRGRATEWTQRFANPEGRAAAAVAAGTNDVAAAAAQLRSSGAPGHSEAAEREDSGSQARGQAPQTAQAKATATAEDAPLESQGPATQGQAAERGGADAPESEAAPGKAATSDAGQLADAHAAQQDATSSRPTDVHAVVVGSNSNGAVTAASGSGQVQVQALAGTQTAGAATRPAPKSRLALGKRARA